MHQNHPVFQIYIPDTIFSQFKSHLNDGSGVNIKLVGLVEKVPSFLLNDGTSGSGGGGDSKKKKTKIKLVSPSPGSVIVSVVGLLVTRSKGRQVQDVEEENIVGEIVAGRDDEPLLERPHQDVWLTLRISENVVTVDQICLDNTTLLPDPHSVVIMQYDPKVLKYAFLLDLPRSGLPTIVIQGFGYKTSVPGNHGTNSDTGVGTFVPLLFQDTEEIINKVDPRGYCQEEMKTNYTSLESAGILKYSSGLKQIFYKMTLMSNVLRGEISGLALGNIVMILVLDILLGFAFTHFLLQFPNLFTILHVKIEQLLKVLLHVLNWLRGSPAGLKLNSALNSLLWRFFSYHLHLWANYIGILEPILSFILSIIINFGPLGLTVQISLIKDLLTIATFHVYCLYIYATRLYAVQLATLQSMGRLFLGRKWNPLRNRFDHVQLSKSEMFLSSMGFTIGVFLFPTTIIYYVVFLCLRIPVLLVESALIYFVNALNSYEIVTKILIILNCPKVSDAMYLRIIPDSPILTFRVCLQTTKSVFNLPKMTTSFRTILRSMTQGKVLH